MIYCECLQKQIFCHKCVFHHSVTRSHESELNAALKHSLRSLSFSQFQCVPQKATCHFWIHTDSEWHPHFDLNTMLIWLWDCQMQWSQNLTHTNTHAYQQHTVKCLSYIHSKVFIQHGTFIMPLKVQSQELPAANLQKICNFSMPCALAKQRAVSKAASVPTAAHAWPLHISSFHTPFLLHLLECWVFFSDFNERVFFLLKGVCVGRVKDDLIPSRREKERKRLI